MQGKIDNIDLMDPYDGQINVVDTVGREDVIIHFKAQAESLKDYGGFRYGKAVIYQPRKGILSIKVNGFGRLFKVDQGHCIDALVGPKGDRDKVRVIWS